MIGNSGERLEPKWTIPTIAANHPIRRAGARLKQQLAAYRVVFGQPRQEELLGLLNRSDIDPQDLASWSINLSPS